MNCTTGIIGRVALVAAALLAGAGITRAQEGSASPPAEDQKPKDAAQAPGETPAQTPAETPPPPPDPVQTPTSDADIVALPSGLRYVDLKVGEGETPAPGATVTVHYSGWLTDGTLFDSSVKRGEPVTFRLDEVIAGWTEGVGAMKVGGKRKLFVPPGLGYGARGNPPNIPADAELIFEVELLSVQQPPKPSSCEGIEAVATDTGVKLYDLAVGQGEPPDVNDDLTLRYKAWRSDGTFFDSSDRAGPAMHSSLARLRQAIPGLADGCKSMRPGGKRQMIIPPEMGFVQAERMKLPKDTTMVFEVELMSIEKAPQMTPTEGMKEVVTDSGLKYIDLKEGTGDSPQPTSTVTVHYSGWLPDGIMFDSSVKRGAPATLQLGQMIPGWIEGVGSMKVGGKRKLIIPPDLGYGPQGSPPMIPANATLVFEVELLGFN